MTENLKIDVRNILICVGIVSVAMLLTWPFADLAYGDDVAYAHVAYTLHQTGRMIYNGWEAAVLLLHAHWGNLIISHFGFSFVGLRLSTTPFALGAVAFCYLLVRKAGLSPSDSVLVTLIVGLSPLFLPLSVSYMTDVPGLFFVFASLFFFIRATLTSKKTWSYFWLILGAAIGFIGGTGRQVAWFVPLALLPYLAWVRRRDLLFVGVSLANWVFVLVGVLRVERWLNRQLYVAHQPSIIGEFIRDLRQPFQEINLTARFALMLIFMVLPAAFPLILRSALETWRGPRDRQILVGVLFLLLFSAIAIHPSLVSIPWVNSTLNWEGINGATPLPGRPVVLTRPIRVIAALTVYVSVCLLAGNLLGISRLARQSWIAIWNPSKSQFGIAAMTLFSVSYLLTMLIRAGEFDAFDRYLLPVMPWASTLLLVWFQKDNAFTKEIHQRSMPYCWILLIVLASYAVLSTQDLWALAQARVRATKKLELAGVPRTAIDAGMEYNAWTELTATGHLNDRNVVNPPDAYRAGLGMTPEVVPVYRLEYRPVPGTRSSEFGSVPYFSLLPPFWKQVSIDRIVGDTEKRM